MAPAEAVTSPVTRAPRLLLINGAPATGKSSVARRYVADRPLALALDIDVVRGLLGGWRSDPRAAGLAARRLALTMAGDHLAAGHDVVIPQQLTRMDFIDQLEQLAVGAGAGWTQVVLTADPDELIARFERRTAAALQPEHSDAQELIDAAGGLSVIRGVVADLRVLAETRELPVIETTGLSENQVYEAILAVIVGAGADGEREQTGSNSPSRRVDERSGAGTGAGRSESAGG